VLNRKVEIHYDFRAISHIELEYKGRAKIKIYLMKLLEKFIYKKATTVGAVSQNLLKELTRRFGNRCEQSTVFPCVYSFKPVSKDNLIEKKERLSIVYVGGLSSWQKFDSILDFIKVLENKSKKISFLVLTSDVVLAKRLTQSKFGSLPSYITFDTVPTREIPRVISSYHYGIIFRDNVVMNRVSSPIKVGEYIGSGLIPIYTDGIGDYSDLFKKLDVGYSVNLNSMNDVAERIVQNFNDGLYDELQLKVLKVNKMFHIDSIISKHPFVCGS
ncbi:hypothetical protein, partial [Vibrio antiquarius]